MTATKSRTKSPLQANDAFPSVFVVDSIVAPEEKQDYLDTRYVEFVNAERTIAVVSNYSTYYVALRTGLTTSDVVPDDSRYFTDDYEPLRQRGLWVLLQDTDDKSKMRVRTRAEGIQQRVQDIQQPLEVSLDGSFATALTIASQKWESTRDYYRDSERRSALREIAEKAGVDPSLLALAVKEDRLIWSTPPAAPKQVLVVVKETATANLTERLVDEIVLASKEVEGFGRIVHQGSVTEYLLARRTWKQAAAVREILQARENLQEALQRVQSRTQRLLDDLAEGNVVGRGFHDTVRLADEAEKVQAAAGAYTHAVISADLPEDFNTALRQGAYLDTEKYASVYSHTAKALEALSALTGADYGDV